MSNLTTIALLERPGVGRLGRHIEHDERSRAFQTVPRLTNLRSVQWPRHCPPFDQGDVGSCTGNAMAGALMTGPLYAHGRDLTEKDALALYSAATHLDTVAGHYPPEDTGSSGLAVAKAAKRANYIKEYRHAFGINAALSALTLGPIIIGIGWYEGFDAPQSYEAELVISGQVRGGHEVVLDGIDVERGLVKGTNSWGTAWGSGGRFAMSFGTFKRLLAERGDVVVPQ